MAKVIAIGQPVNESEREAVAYLRDHLPDSFTVIHNFELRQGNSVFEIDLALLGPHCVHVIDVKGTRGLVDVYGSKWYPEGRAPYHSPLALLRGHAKALKSLICDQHPTDRELRSVHVDAAVLMTAPDAHVQDPGGHDAPAVAYLKKCTTFFKSTARIPDNRSADIRHHFGKIRRAIVGRAQPRSAPPCYGSWQVEEKLGGTDRYTEYRARHTLLGARRGGTARLRVYPVDPYLPSAERKRERRRIENAFQAVASLPGHAHILTVRDFFANEAEDQLVLVTEDVAGHALRQHIKKSAMALTFDQKIAVVRDTLAALDHAHRSEPQVVHRNLTPDAVIVSASGRTLLCGFDYARAGQDRTSTIAGEIADELDPMYQAPECDRDPSQASVASDLYAAGLVFYELLVGRAGMVVGRRHDEQRRGLSGEAVRVETGVEAGIRCLAAGAVRFRHRGSTGLRGHRTDTVQPHRRPRPAHRRRQDPAADHTRACAAGPGLRNVAARRRPCRPLPD